MPIDTPFIKEICEMFDTQVMTDLDTNENVVYVIGHPGEIAAGIRYHTISPPKPTLAELENFAERNIERYRRAFVFQCDIADEIVNLT